MVTANCADADLGLSNPSTEEVKRFVDDPKAYQLRIKVERIGPISSTASLTQRRSNRMRGVIETVSDPVNIAQKLHRPTAAQTVSFQKQFKLSCASRIFYCLVVSANPGQQLQQQKHHI